MADSKEGRPRGAHFASSRPAGAAPGPRPERPAAPVPGPGQSRAASPDETTAFLIAAGIEPGALPSERRFPLAAPDETAAFILAADAARPEALAATAPAPAPDVTASVAALPSDAPVPRAPSAAAPAASDDADREAQVGRSAALMSVLVIISRITGFFRTIAQAYGMGATLGVASAFTVANGMPNQLYELVMGGMLVTAFLPVYVSAKKAAGKEGASAYASNLISLVTILMVGLTVLSLIFAGPIIYSQSFGASEGFDFDLAVYFFRYFAICIVFYALSSVISSVLNAERDYLWSTLAPVANNIVTAAAFLLYGVLVSMGQPETAILVLAIGNPLSVLIQVLVQVPSLRRHGIRLRLRVDIHDPRIRETLSIGIPTLIVTVVSFATNSVQSATSLQVDPNGAVITYYARVWYILPYAVLAVPVTVAMFTELSVYVADGRMQRFIDGVASGCGKILFMLTPFAMYLMVFARALSYMLGSSRMPEGTAESLAVYLIWLSISLPGYGVCTYLQKACSSLRKMRIFALAECIAGALQIAICLIFTPIFGLNIVGFSSTFFFIAIDAVTLFIIRRDLGSIGGRKILASLAKSLVFGGLGAAVGWAALFGLEHLVAPLSGGTFQAIAYAVAAGLPAVAVTFGLALAMRVPEASFIASALRLKRPGAARA